MLSRASQFPSHIFSTNTSAPTSSLDLSRSWTSGTTPLVDGASVRQGVKLENSIWSSSDRDSGSQPSGFLGVDPSSSSPWYPRGSIVLHPNARRSRQLPPAVVHVDDSRDEARPASSSTDISLDFVSPGQPHRHLNGDLRQIGPPPHWGQKYATGPQQRVTVTHLPFGSLGSLPLPQGWPDGETRHPPWINLQQHDPVRSLSSQQG